jgi:4,5-DOPA dioxygenase extradiol
MNRRNFVKSLGALALTPHVMKLNELSKLSDSMLNTDLMPLLFVGHGNPMNAIQDNSITLGWSKIANELDTPKAILCISAHWETKGTYVTMMDTPRTIHDFGGFPQELFDVQYPAPGSPEFAKIVQQKVTSSNIGANHDWGLDHGSWSILVKMYPKANISVFQMSIDYTKPAEYHYNLAKELKELRKKGVLILGSGNIVHNLRYANLSTSATAYDWAIEFDEQSKSLIDAGDHHSLVHYEKLGKAAQLSIPTPEHYLPLLYVLGLQEEHECVEFFNEEMAFGSGSMRSLLIK